MDRAGGVGAVAVLQTAEVEDDHVAALDDAVAHLVVRVGAVRSGGDDGEVDLGVTEAAEQVGEVGGDVGLVASAEGNLPDLLERCVCGRTRGRQQLQLRRVLDGTQHRQGVGEGGVRGGRQCLLQSEQMHRPGVVADAEPAEPEPLIEQGGGGGVGVLAVGPVAQGQAGRAGGLRGVRGFQGGDDEDGVPAGDENQQGEPLGLRGGRVAGEPHQVRAGCHQQSGQPGVRGRPRCAFPAGPVVVGGEGRGCGAGHPGLPGRVKGTTGSILPGRRGRREPVDGAFVRSAGDGVSRRVPCGRRGAAARLRRSVPGAGAHPRGTARSSSGRRTTRTSRSSRPRRPLRERPGQPPPLP